MPCQKHRGNNLIGFDDMVQVGAAELAAGRTIAFWVQRAFIIRKTGIFKVERAKAGKSLSISAGPSWQYAIEHIDTPQHRPDDVVGLSHAHKVAGPVSGQMG